jgi:hypothetical protein|tara:strand:+ start:2397 stop:3251 length:855 start_codon:yes stop_codon:yes gene_type:complete
MTISRLQIPKQLVPHFNEGGSKYEGQLQALLARNIGQRTGISSIPVLGQRFEKFSENQLGRLGQAMQRIPFAKPIGDLGNRLAYTANKVADFVSPVTDPIGSIISAIQKRRGNAGNSPAGKGILGLGGRRRERQSQQAYQDLTNYDVNAGYPDPSQQAYQDLTNYDVNAGYPDPSQDSNMTVEEFMAAQDPFAGQGPISPGGGLDSYGFGQSLEGIRHRDMTGILNEIDEMVKKDQPFMQIDDPSGQYYQLIDKQTGDIIMSGRHHKDHKPSMRPRMSGIGGGL